MTVARLLVLASAVASVAATKFKICPDVTPSVDVTAVDLSRLVPGEPLSVTVSGVPSIEIPNSDIEAQVQIFVLGFKLGHASFNFCTEMQGVSCPLPAGKPFTGTISYTIPKEAPTGVELTTRINVKNLDSSEEYTCVEVDVKVKTMLGRQFESSLPAVTSALVDAVNERATSWRAHVSPRFAGYTIADARRIAGGTIMKGHPDYFELPPKTYSARSSAGASGGGPAFELAPEGAVSDGAADGVDTDIPDSFDAREAWPECADVIGRIRDQSDCGACWAFASAEAASDRNCIRKLASDGAPDLTVLSAEDTVSCCKGLTCGLSMGCNGGQPSAAWHWFTRRGVVSGLDYADMGAGTSCKPYEFKPCAHHVDPAAAGYPDCGDEAEYPTPECTKACTDAAYSNTFNADKRHAASAYSLRSVSDIQRSLMESGPVTAAFSVYGDFLTYAGGVYQHETGSYMGGHAVKIIGWGVDAECGLPYWLVANSWNASWGEGGLFRILRGSNQCGIEGMVVAGDF